MQLDAAHLILSATDVSAHMACAHKTWLEWERVHGRLRRPYFEDPGVDVLRQRGHEHEARVLAGYEGEGRSIRKLDRPPRGAEGARQGAAETLQAMRDGVQVIYQATLFDDPWLGFPDFLVRVETPSDLGAWSYEVVDAKLSREAKVGAVLQICFYSELLERAQGVPPERMHLALGGPGGTPEPFRVADYAGYYRWAKRHFAEAMAGNAEATTYPEPVAHCDVCDWKPLCRERWDQDDHLSLVAGITRKQRHELEERGVATLARSGASRCRWCRPCAR